MYIGAGLHLAPLVHFKDTSEFIFVDTLPRSEFDSKQIFRDYYYRHTFIKQLKEKCMSMGFLLQSDKEIDENYHRQIMTLGQRLYWFNVVKQTFPHINPSLLVFYNKDTNQILKYYVSTNLKFNGLIDDLYHCDGIIISGHLPDSVLGQYMSQGMKLYGYTRTVYLSDERDDSTVVDVINENNFLISEYFSCDVKTGLVTKVSNLLDIK